MALFLSLWSFYSTDFTQSFSGCLKVFYVVFAFGSALCLGALKGMSFVCLYFFFFKEKKVSFFSFFLAVIHGLWDGLFSTFAWCLLKI